MDGRGGNGRPRQNWTADAELDGRGGTGRPRCNWTADVEMDGRNGLDGRGLLDAEGFFKEVNSEKSNEYPPESTFFDSEIEPCPTLKVHPFTGPKSKVQVQVLLTSPRM